MTSFLATDTRLTNFYQAIRGNLDQLSTTTMDNFFSHYTNATKTSLTIPTKISDLLTFENNVNNYLQSSSIVSGVTGNIVQTTQSLNNNVYISLSELYANIDRERLDLQAQSTKGVSGDKGQTGDKGLKGERGDKGLPGTNGLLGANGKDGINGKNGANGKDGINGKNGSNGKDGIKGPIGDKGPAGGLKGDTGPIGPAGPAGKDITQIADGSISIAKIDPNSGPLNITQIPLLDASQIDPNGSAFNLAQIPLLDAANVATGIFQANQIPDLSEIYVAIPVIDTTKTFGSFYSCGNDFTGTNKTLIATGSSIPALQSAAIQACVLLQSLYYKIDSFNNGTFTESSVDITTPIPAIPSASSETPSNPSNTSFMEIFIGSRSEFFSFVPDGYCFATSGAATIACMYSIMTEIPSLVGEHN